MYDVSICMPYFERGEQLQNTLDSFIKAGYCEKKYPHEIAISIVDDGSINEPAEPILYKMKPRPITFLCNLPQKTTWKNPCVPLNKAVRQTESPFILLQSPETYHPMPIVDKMVEMIDNKRVIVLCSVKSTKGSLPWYAHPTHRPVKYWFCQMMTREFFEEIGGFDESLREGHGWDDDDFIMRATKEGANWTWLSTQYHVVHVNTPKRLPKESNIKAFIDKYGKHHAD